MEFEGSFGPLGMVVKKSPQERIEERLVKDKERKIMLGRGTASGGNKLKKLTGRHLRMISMHLSGECKGKDIAEEVGCSVASVYGVLNDPLSKNIIEKFREGQVEDLKSLYPKVVAAISDGLEAGDINTKLKTIDRYVKLVDVEEKEEEEKNISITVVDARARFVETLSQMIDVTPEKVAS